MSRPNKCIWITESNELQVRKVEEDYVPSGSQILVETIYSGINPADLKHGQNLGMNNYPAGYEFSGRVVAKGPQSEFEIGQAVLGHNWASKNKPRYHGAHQDFLIGEHSLCSIPPSLPVVDAACVSIIASTAADALFNQLELPGGQVLCEHSAKGPLLIWGGSSSVGVAAIQLAKAAGMEPIFVTASTRNHDTIKSLGADICFDYNDPGIVERLAKELKKLKDEVIRTFDTVCATPELVDDCLKGVDAVVVGTLPQPTRPAWKFTLATRSAPFVAHHQNGVTIMGKPRADWQAKIDKALQWCLNHYGEDKGFRLPNVVAVSGADNAVQCIKNVAEGKSSMTKYAIKHPL